MIATGDVMKIYLVHSCSSMYVSGGIIISMHVIERGYIAKSFVSCMSFTDVCYSTPQHSGRCCQVHLSDDTGTSWKHNCKQTDQWQQLQY